MLEVVGRAPLVNELIVVDDGSVDGTADVARAGRARVIRLGTNRGKGAALQAGLESTEADILLFVDADLVGLSDDHILDLLTPLLEDEELVMTVGRFTGGRLRTDLAQKLVPSISGQRALRRQFLEGFSNLANMGFEVEVALTRHAKRSGAKFREIELSDLTQVMKEEKLGWPRGILSRMRMYGQMLGHMFLDRLSGR